MNPPGTPMRRLASGIDHDPLPESDAGGVHLYRPGEKITALTPEQLRSVTALGFRTVQFAAGPHFNEDVDRDGKGDWSELDANLALVAEHGMEALLVTGFYWMPPWMKDDPRAVALRCRTHDRAIPILSPWSPFTLEWIDRCAGQLAEHLQAVQAPVAALQVMICGDFGEAIFPAGMMNVPGQSPQRWCGEGMHNHPDFWCNDGCAREDFAAAVGTGQSADDPDLFPQPPTEGRTARPWLDFLNWYHDAMTRYAGQVLAAYRRHFPAPDLVIWLGGGVEPHSHGQDNSALPKAVKKVGGTVRSTAAGSQLMFRKLVEPSQTLAWAYQRNHPIVRRTSTACKFYGVAYWLEAPYPPGMNDEEIVARVFEAAGCGAAGYFEWSRTLERYGPTVEKLAKWLVTARPLVDVAVYFPQTTHRLRPDAYMPLRYWEGAAHLRAVTDFDVVDDRLIRDGALADYGLLALIEAEQIEDDVAAAIGAWVAEGGILFAEEGSDERFEGAGQVIHVTLEEEACARAVQHVLRDLPPGRCDAARAAAGWMQCSGAVFATVFDAGILLANLAPEDVGADDGDRQCHLPPLSIAFVDAHQR